MTPEWLVAAAAAVLCAVIVTLAARGAFASARRRAVARARSKRATSGERRAAVLLDNLGYEIEASQETTRYALLADGHPIDVSLRADYLVRRAGKRFVAEVKTGDHAPRIETPATRRQLLEYGLAFDVDGVLLVDVDGESVREIVFPRFPNTRPNTCAETTSAVKRTWFVVALAALGLAYFVEKLRLTGFRTRTYRTTMRLHSSKSMP